MGREYRHLRYEVVDGVLTLTLHRPERLNAYTPLMGQELLDAFDRADADDDVRVVVLTGSGKAFCAGADLAEGGPSRFDYPDGTDHRDFGGRIAMRIFASLKPTISAVNGAAVGFGATVLLPTDVRLASSRARFGYTFGRIGLVPEAASSWFLPRVVGISRAMEWAVTGRVFGAAEALEAGLIRSVHEPEELLPAACALAREMADATAPVAVALTRQMLWRMLGASDPMQAHELDSRAMYERGRSEDVREGITAFLEKRPARFPGRVSTDMPAFYPWWTEQPFRPLPP
ncbi:enoyl-CoA hydratase-related protein [Streptomyces sp. NPDC002577]